MTDVTESFNIEATDGQKAGVLTLLYVAKQTAEELPDGKRYDVTIEVEEHE